MHATSSFSEHLLPQIKAAVSNAQLYSTKKHVPLGSQRSSVAQEVTKCDL